jgi:hypothetical protein
LFLDRAPNFLVAADNGIKLAFARVLGQVAGIFLEGLIAFFRILTVCRAALAQLGDGAFQRLRRHTGIFQNVCSRIPSQACNGEQQAFGGDESVPGLLRAGFSFLEELRARLFKAQAACSGAGNFRLFAEGGINALHSQFRPAAGSADKVCRELVAVFKQGFENVRRGQHLVTGSQRGGLRALDDGAGSFGVLLKVHGFIPFWRQICIACRPRSAAAVSLKAMWE